MELSPETPWPGLHSYSEKDRDYFFGREQETIELHRLIRAENVSLLFGVSGLGKTSLLQAGLFPKLRGEAALPVYIRLDYSETAEPLTKQVLDSIAREDRKSTRLNSSHSQISYAVFCLK